MPIYDLRAMVNKHRELEEKFNNGGFEENALKQEAKEISSLKLQNDKLLQGISDINQKHEASQQLITDSFKQIIETKNYEIQDLKEQVRDLEKDYDGLVEDYNHLLKTRNLENQTNKTIISGKDEKIKELDGVLEKIHDYVSTKINDYCLSDDIGSIIKNSAMDKTHSLFDANEGLKISAKEIVLDRAEEPTHLCGTKSDKSKDDGLGY